MLYNIFNELNKIHQKPKPFEFYTTPDLWNTPYIARQMLKMHLDPDNEPASRNHAFIRKSINWIIKEFNINKDSV